MGASYDLLPCMALVRALLLGANGAFANDFPRVLSLMSCRVAAFQPYYFQETTCLRICSFVPLDSC